MRNDLKIGEIMFGSKFHIGEKEENANGFGETKKKEYL